MAHNRSSINTDEMNDCNLKNLGTQQSVDQLPCQMRTKANRGKVKGITSIFKVSKKRKPRSAVIYLYVLVQRLG